MGRQIAKAAAVLIALIAIFALATLIQDLIETGQKPKLPTYYSPSRVELINKGPWREPYLAYRALGEAARSEGCNMKKSPTETEIKLYSAIEKFYNQKVEAALKVAKNKKPARLPQKAPPLVIMRFLVCGPTR